MGILNCAEQVHCPYSPLLTSQYCWQVWRRTPTVGAILTAETIAEDGGRMEWSNRRDREFCGIQIALSLPFEMS